MSRPRTGWVVVNADGHPMGVDSASGGYPWKPTTTGGIHFWDDEHAAAKWASMFAKDGLRVASYTLTIED